MKNEKAVSMWARLRAEGVPTVITGREAARISIRETGAIVAGLRRDANSDSHPVSLAEACQKIARA